MAPGEKQPFPVNGEAHAQANKRKPTVPLEMMCGFGPCHPVFMQCCARMGCFVGVYSMCGLMTSILSMYIVSQITTIEKQFGFSSSQSGFLLSCNDIGYLLTTLFFSYLARKVHIPRTLWFCTVLYGLAGIICSMSFFIAKDSIEEQAKMLFAGSDANPQFNQSTSKPTSRAPMCVLASNDSSNLNMNGSLCDVEDSKKSFGIGIPNEFSKSALVLIAIGMMIQGLGKAPRYPFLTTYVDDNVKKKNTAMYMGIVSGVGIFGPAIAFSVGGLFSSLYVTLDDVPIGPRHPAWIGAWWLGFIVFGIISIVIATPLVFFPKRMRPKIRTPKYRGENSSNCLITLKEFLKSLLRLLTNSVYVPIVLSTCITLFSVAGMIAFSAKYLETQFFIPAWKANILLGAMNVVAASAGTIVGGFVVTKRQLTPLSCIKLTLVVTIISIMLTALGYVFGCSNADIAGFNMPSAHDNTNTSCGLTCGCDNTTYFPVCGSDNVNYMSPCHAGCQGQDGMKFLDCGCAGNGGNATAGLCETSCGMLYPFLIGNIFGAFLATLSMIPTFIVKLSLILNLLVTTYAVQANNVDLDEGALIGTLSSVSALFAKFAGRALAYVCGVLVKFLYLPLTNAQQHSQSIEKEPFGTMVILERDSWNRLLQIPLSDPPLLRESLDSMLMKGDNFVGDLDDCTSTARDDMNTYKCWFAGPVVFGMIVDTTCIIWSSSCSGKGACALYDNDDLRVKKHTFQIIPQLIVVFIYVFVFFKARKKTDWTVDNPDLSVTDGDEAMMNGHGGDLSLTPMDWKADPIYKGTKSPETRTFTS